MSAAASAAAFFSRRPEKSIDTQAASKHPRSGIIAAIDRLIAPLIVFGAAYLGALFFSLRYIPLFQWAALISVAAATALTVLVSDRGRWNLGLFVAPATALKESSAGIGVSILLIGSADLLIMLTTGMRHTIGNGFPAGELAAVFLPAVFHEELLFRGYPFQRLWRWRPWVAVAGVSLLFAALHAWNQAVTMLALTNIFLGGVLLSLAYALFERLWFPIGLHLGWNLLSGPILGYQVSGYPPAASLLRVGGRGPEWLTGGRFGIEGSIWMTGMEVVTIALLWRSQRRKELE